MFAGIITNATDWLDKVASNWWFLLVILAIAFLDAVVPIVPSETCVIIGGVAAADGSYPLPLVIVCAAAGAFLGDNFSFLLGRKAGPWFERRADRKEKSRHRLDARQAPDQGARWGAADHGPLHPRRPNRAHARLRHHRTAPTLVREVDRHRGPDLGQLRSAARLHRWGRLRGRSHQGVPLRLRHRPRRQPRDRARAPLRQAPPRRRREDGVTALAQEAAADAGHGTSV